MLVCNTEAVTAEQSVRQRLDQLLASGSLAPSRYSTLSSMLSEAVEQNNVTLLEDVSTLIAGIPSVAVCRFVLRVVAFGDRPWPTRPTYAQIQQVRSAPHILNLLELATPSRILRYFERLNQAARVSLFLMICAIGCAFGTGSHALTVVASIFLVATASLVGWSRYDQRLSRQILDTLNRQW